MGQHYLYPHISEGVLLPQGVKPIKYQVWVCAAFKEELLSFLVFPDLLHHFPLLPPLPDDHPCGRPLTGMVGVGRPTPLLAWGAGHRLVTPGNHALARHPWVTSLQGNTT